VSRAAAAALKADGAGGGNGAILNSAVGSVDLPDLHILQSHTEAGEWRSIPVQSLNPNSGVVQIRLPS